ncbi:hypothetical protein BCR42DRAFT_401224, partial [Absidia repens]
METTPVDMKDRYLSFWLSMNKLSPNTTLHLPQNTQIKGTYIGTDAENNRFRVDKLQTPMGVYERAVIRGTDVDMIEIQL